MCVLLLHLYKIRYVMKERILQFLESERISPAEFADKIGVQRSSMSHILNGRNYPSASFIQKMLHVYPSVNSRWLMIGEGPMCLDSGIVEMAVTESPASLANPSEIIKDSIISANSSPLNIKNPENEVREEPKQDSVKESGFHIINDPVKAIREEQPPKQSSIISAIQSDEKEIEQVLLFYSDKTFKVYRPA